VVLSRQARFDAAIAMGEPKTGRRPGPPRFRRPSEAAEALFSPKSEPACAPTAEVQVRVKWFEPERGWGFACAIDRSVDYFIHASVVGDLELPRGATLVVRIGDDPAGRPRKVIAEILSVDASTAMPAREKLPPLVVTKIDYGKLSARISGFGFMSSDTGGPDVYLSPKRFLDPGMEDVQIGDPIEADVAIGVGGRLIATAVRRL